MHKVETDQIYYPPEEAASSANIPNYRDVYHESVEDPEKFWGKVAKELYWFKPWERVGIWQSPNHKWFVGAEVNITSNALDRHVHSPRRNKVAYIWLGEDGSEKQITFLQLYHMVNRLANALKSLGVKKGDRVAVFMPQTIEGIMSMLACARIGAVHIAVSTLSGANLLRKNIQSTGAKIVIAADFSYQNGKPVDLRPIVDEAVKDLDSVRKVVIFQRQAKRKLEDNYIDFYEALEAHSKDCPAEHMQAEDPLFILYSSGTGQEPRGIVHVHGGYMVGTYFLAKAFLDLKDEDILWCTHDISSIRGHSFLVYAPLVAGATTVFREGAPDYPGQDTLCKIVDKYGVSILFTSPANLRLLMKHGEARLKEFDLGMLRLIACAGEPLSREVWLWAYHNMLAAHGGCIVDSWWQTETAGPVLGTLPAMTAKPGKVGVMLPGVKAEVVNKNGESIGIGHEGLLVLKEPFPHMMQSIYGNHARYEQTWTSGAYATGVVAEMDQDGYFTVLGHWNDVLSIASRRVGTVEVEGVLSAHPAVAEAAAIGLPDSTGAEVFSVYVTLNDGYSGSQELVQELQRHVHRTLPVAIVSSINFVAQMPKTHSGKIIRRILKAQEENKQ